MEVKLFDFSPTGFGVLSWFEASMSLHCQGSRHLNPSFRMASALCLSVRFFMHSGSLLLLPLQHLRLSLIDYNSQDTVIYQEAKKGGSNAEGLTEANDTLLVPKEGSHLQGVIIVNASTHPPRARRAAG